MENSRLNSKASAIRDLIELIKTLRGANGCPWDKKQTPRSMTAFLIEEVYELADAIESGTHVVICEELGDVLFHIFFIASMFQEMGYFSIEDVARMITEKMIRRHPHVFGTDQVAGSEEVIQNWQKIKRLEKSQTPTDSVLDSVPLQLPALMRAYQILDRSAKAGFEGLNMTSLFEKSQARLEALKAALAAKDKHRIDAALGDIFFTLVHFARRAKIHPEIALTSSLKRFEKRFKRMEKLLTESGRDLQSVSQQEKHEIWQKTKDMLE